MHHCSQTSSDMKGSLALRVEAKSGTVMDTLGEGMHHCSQTSSDFLGR